MTPTLLLLAAGLALLVFGGDLLVRGASGLARSWGVSSMVVGLTVVAFGTSAPELAVNVRAAVEGSSGLSFGNVVGSNLANVGLVLGIAALVRPLAIRGEIVRRELPFMVLLSLAAFAMSADEWLRPEGFVAADRADGTLLLMFFAIFVYSTIAGVFFDESPADPAMREAADEPIGPKTGNPWVNVGLTVAGLAGLIYGGDLTVDAAVQLGRDVGLSEAIIGMTIVAVGTSLPEVVASVIAAFRGETDLAVGNVVGSNIFNLGLVLGTTAVVAPVDVPEGGLMDLALATGLAALLIVMAVFGRARIARPSGILLLAVWIGYSAWRATSALEPPLG